MGPLAGADFFTKLIKCTPAVKDEGHIPVLLMSDPTVPSRPKALLEGTYACFHEKSIDRTR